MDYNADERFPYRSDVQTANKTQMEMVLAVKEEWSCSDSIRFPLIEGVSPGEGSRGYDITSLLKRCNQSFKEGPLQSLPFRRTRSSLSDIFLFEPYACSQRDRAHYVDHSLIFQLPPRLGSGPVSMIHRLFYGYFVNVCQIWSYHPSLTSCWQSQCRVFEAQRSGRS